MLCCRDGNFSDQAPHVVLLGVEAFNPANCDVLVAPRRHAGTEPAKHVAIPNGKIEAPRRPNHLIVNRIPRQSAVRVGSSEVLNRLPKSQGPLVKRHNLQVATCGNLRGKLVPRDVIGRIAKPLVSEMCKGVPRWGYQS